PRPEIPPQRRGRGAGRFSWVLGVAALLIGVTILLNAVEGGSDARPGGPAAGGTLPDFATPAADAKLEGDANLATEETAGTDAGPRPACEVRRPDVVNICELRERGPLVLAIFPAEAKRCRAVLRQFDRASAAYRGRVTFVAVGSSGDRKDLRGHAFPVGWDHDGAIAKVYGLAGCPQITFARRGGTVLETTHRDLTDAELRARVERLLR
ncbi:MAG TPA: hypothetical protein VN238_08555, partial [Solirubrobacteraceae bacterium]|nr:hypothetical protein [Solirubrobacteraceae bacterium]